MKVGVNRVNSSVPLIEADVRVCSVTKQKHVLPTWPTKNDGSSVVEKACESHLGFFNGRVPEPMTCLPACLFGLRSGFGM